MTIIETPPASTKEAPPMDDAGDTAPNSEEPEASGKPTAEAAGTNIGDDDSGTFYGTDAVGRARERKIKHWEESAFATGCVSVTWKDDRPSWLCPTSKTNDRAAIDTTFPISSLVCGCLGADRVGNMAVLAQTTENFEEEVMDPETGQVTTHRKKRPKLLWVVGPYWTVNLFITFPLIFGVSGWICYSRILGSGLILMISWSIGTFLLIFSLCMISCRNPGILYRHSQIPLNTDEDWRWNDQARTYRPASSRFDSECQVVIEGFDHTCPWTGTAIGSANMFWFKVFVSMVVIMLVYTVTVGIFLGSLTRLF